MKIEIDLPDYEDGIDVFWDTDAKMSLHLEENHVVLSMNNVALLSLAKQLIYLSQDSVPEFSHIHYDNFTFDGFLSNRELVVVKKEYSNSKMFYEMFKNIDQLYSFIASGKKLEFTYKNNRYIVFPIFEEQSSVGVGLIEVNDESFSKYYSVEELSTSYIDHSKLIDILSDIEIVWHS